MPPPLCMCTIMPCLCMVVWLVADSHSCAGQEGQPWHVCDQQRYPASHSPHLHGPPLLLPASSRACTHHPCHQAVTPHCTRLPCKHGQAACSRGALRELIPTCCIPATQSTWLLTTRRMCCRQVVAMARHCKALKTQTANQIHMQGLACIGSELSSNVLLC